MSSHQLFGGICSYSNPFLPTVPTLAFRETDVSRHNGGASGTSLKPLRDDSALRALSTVSQTANDGTVGKNWLRIRNGGQKWVKLIHRNIPGMAVTVWYIKLQTFIKQV